MKTKKKQQRIKGKANIAPTKGTIMTFNQWANKGANLKGDAFDKAVSELEKFPQGAPVTEIEHVYDPTGFNPLFKGLIWYQAMSKQDLIQKFQSLKSDEARAFFAYQQREKIRSRAQIKIRLRRMAENIEKSKNSRPDEMERMLSIEL